MISKIAINEEQIVDIILQTKEKYVKERLIIAAESFGYVIKRDNNAIVVVFTVMYDERVGFLICAEPLTTDEGKNVLIGDEEAKEMNAENMIIFVNEALRMVVELPPEASLNRIKESVESLINELKLFFPYYIVSFEIDDDDDTSFERDDVWLLGKMRNK